MKKILFIASLFFIPLGLSAANLTPGSQWTFEGNGTRESALGDTGMVSLNSLTAADYNPAALADLRRMANNLSISGLATGNTLFNAGIALPTLSGVYGIRVNYLSGPGGASLSQWMKLGLSISKPITPGLYWGASLNFGLADSNNANDWALGLDTGIIRVIPDNPTNYGVGFRHLSFGFALKNLGKLAELGNNDPFPGMGMGLGGAFYPVYLKNYKIRVSSDIFVPWSPLDFAFGVGIEQSLWNMFFLRGGYQYSANGIGPWSFGAGFKGVILVQGSKTDIDIDYAARTQSFNGTSELAHALNLSVAWGYYDDVKPDVKAIPLETAFSPNVDGSQDELQIKLDIKDNKLVDSWEVDIENQNGKVIRRFKSVDKLAVRNLSPKKFIEQIFSAKKQVEIPSSIKWDGMDSTGKRVADGNYRVVLKATDENNNTAIYQAGSVRVDTVVPVVRPVVSDLLFSPNGDDAKETLNIKLRFTNLQKGDVLSLIFKNKDGHVVRKESFSAHVPNKYEWDGKDNQGKPLPEGTYSLIAEISDEAGNKTVVPVNNIRLFRTIQKIKLNTKTVEISPNGDGVDDVLTIQPTVSDQTGLQNWILRITDAHSNVVKVMEGHQSLPKSISWNGIDNKGNKLPDGTYFYQLSLRYDSGNHPETKPAPVVIDTTPAKVEIKPQYLSFSPNNDGKKDSLRFNQSIRGNDNDQVQATIKDQSGNVVYYTKYTKKDFPKIFVWKGLDSNLNPLPEGKYTYTVETRDKVGNKSETKIADIILKTGLEKVSVLANAIAISPGHPDARDLVRFTPSLSSDKDVTEFVLNIRNNKGQVVKRFKSNKVMKYIDWTGSGNKGHVLPDGTYYYDLKVKYSYGDEPKSAERTIRIDTEAPAVSLTCPTPAFSPNGDGRLDTLPLRLSIKGKKEDRYVLAITPSESSKIVRHFVWIGSVPEKLAWDGKDDEGNNLPEGSYDIIFKGQDSAKNSSTSILRNIKLKRSFEKLDFIADFKALSLHGDPENRHITFKATLSSTNGLLDSKIEIINSRGKIVRTFEKQKALLAQIKWKGLDNAGKPVSDGTYTAFMSAEFDSGNLIQKQIKDIIVDSTPPTYKLVISPKLFTPDGDGENDTLFINLSVNDANTVSSWAIKIYKKEPGWEKTDPLKQFRGIGTIKKLIKWDGKGDDPDDAVESVQDYVLVLEAVDSLGNKLTNVQRIIPVGVLVEKTPDGLRIRVSSVTFAVDRANLTTHSKKVLDKVIRILVRIMSDPTKYGLGKNFKIEISGHTDDTGTEKHNMKLSERRALSVYKYLISKDIDPNILVYNGYGETRPVKKITPTMSKKQKEKYRAKNRRVEFFIRK